MAEEFKTTAEALLVLAHRKKLTSGDLARLAGLHPNTVIAYMKDRILPATMKTINKLAEALEVDPAWLQAHVQRDLDRGHRESLESK